MSHLTLVFAYSDGQIQLQRTEFKFSSHLEFVAVRGKTSGAYKGIGSFQWTPAVKAMCVLFLQALIRSHKNTDMNAPTISGKRGSLASSLDYAIDKEPHWLCDMFGLDMSGKTNLRRLILRSNTGCKRPEPVCLSLDESALPAKNIKVLINSTPVSDPAILETMIGMLSSEYTNTPKEPPFDFSALPCYAS